MSLMPLQQVHATGCHIDTTVTNAYNHENMWQCITIQYYSINYWSVLHFYSVIGLSPSRRRAGVYR